jgi:hypothetical protein
MFPTTLEAALKTAIEKELVLKTSCPAYINTVIHNQKIIMEALLHILDGRAH